MNPVMFCRNTRGIPALAAQFNEVCAFLAGFGEQDAVVGHDAYLMAVDVQTRIPVVPYRDLNSETRSIDDTSDQFAHVDRGTVISRMKFHQVLNIVSRRFRFCHGCRCLFGGAEVFNDVANHAAPRLRPREVVCYPDRAVCTPAPPSSSAGLPPL